MYIPNTIALISAAPARNEVHTDEDPGGVWAAMDIMDEDVAMIAVQLMQSIPIL